jgi:hypothetical protein
MRAAFDLFRAQRQQGLSTVQCLDLALLIDAQHQRVLGWHEIERDDIVE